MRRRKKNLQIILKKNEDIKTENKGCVHCGRLKELRKKAGLSRHELFEKTGISVQTIARLEQNNVVTATDTLVKLADYFKRPYGYLLGEETPSLEKYSLSPELKSILIKFLDKLMEAKSSPLELLDAVCVLIDAQAGQVGTRKGIEEEEEVLGLWWSIISAYEQSKWDTMIVKSKALICLAEALGRVHLAALGHAYTAKAVRNIAGEHAGENAEDELRKIPHEKEFQSALVFRMFGKIYSQAERLDEALKEYQKAESLMIESRRDDTLFLLERAKLLRNLSCVHRKLAEKAGESGDQEGKAGHLEEARKYLERCGDSIGRFAKTIEHEAGIEKLLLTYSWAWYYKVAGRREDAIDSAKQALKLAEQLEQAEYAAKIKMFLFHLYMEIGRKEDAIQYYGVIFPLEKYSGGRFKWHYENLILPHQSRILASLVKHFRRQKKDCDALIRQRQMLDSDKPE